MPNPLAFLTRMSPDRLGYLQQSIEQRPGGLTGLMDRPGVNEGLLAFGLNMLAADKKRESFGQSLLRSTSAGIGVGREAAAREKYEEALSGMPPEMARVMSLIGPERGALLLAQQAMTPRATTVLGEGDSLVADGTGEILATNEKPEEFGRQTLADGTIGIFDRAGNLVRTEGPEDDDSKFGEIAQLRTRFEQNIAPYEQSAQAFRKMEASATGDATPAKDIALIFNYMKAIDPSSSVREGEYATAQNAGSAFDIVGNLYNRLLRGTRLNEQQRAEFLNSAREQVASQLTQYQEVADQYRGIAESNGFDVGQVIRDPFTGLNLAPPSAGGADPLGIR